MEALNPAAVVRAVVAKSEHFDLGVWHLYQVLRRDGWPTWDQLSTAQRAQLRRALLVGAAEIDDARFLRG